MRNCSGHATIKCHHQFNHANQASDISSHENVFYASPMGAGGIQTQPIK